MYLLLLYCVILSLSCIPALKNTFSDINIDLQAFFWLGLHVYFFLYFNFYFPWILVLRWAQYMVRFCCCCWSLFLLKVCVLSLLSLNWIYLLKCLELSLLSCHLLSIPCSVSLFYFPFLLSCLLLMNYLPFSLFFF